MKSLLKKRLPGILVAGLVTLAVGAASAPASAAPVNASTVKPSSIATSSGATVSGLTKNQTKARSRALAQCNRKRPARVKNACRKQVIRKYQAISRRQNGPTTPPIRKTWTVDVGFGGNFFLPGTLDIKVNDAILWSWAKISTPEAHNAELQAPTPPGVTPAQFKSATTAVSSYRFKRQFVKPGQYNFLCTLHFGMTLGVNVTR